jgi:transposase
VVPRVHGLIEDAESELPDALRAHLYEACLEILDLERKMEEVEKQLEALAKQNPATQRLLTIPGIGVLTATALVGFIGDLKRFRSGRHFASYLGLVPKERSSGNVRRLGRITKKGDSYIRMLLTHGSRSVLNAAKRKEKPDQLRSWALKIEKARGHNKATIALANKLARIAWAVSTRDIQFQSRATTA